MMIPKLLTSRNTSLAGLRVLSSLLLLGTAVACGETNDPQPEATRTGTGRNQPADNDDGTPRNTAQGDDGPAANADDDGDRDLSIGSEEIDEDLGISGGRTRSGGGGGGRSRTNTRDIELSDGGVDVDAGDVDAGDVDAGEDVDVDAGVDEEVVVDAGDAGVAP
jgi:hypothetical protein